MFGLKKSTGTEVNYFTSPVLIFSAIDYFQSEVFEVTLDDLKTIGLFLSFSNRDKQDNLPSKIKNYREWISTIPFILCSTLI